MRSTLQFALGGAVMMGLVTACSSAVEPASGYEPQLFDGERLLEITEILASDELMGRGVGTPGNAAARDLLKLEMATIGLSPLEVDFEHPFTYGAMDGDGPQKTGINLIGKVEGTGETGRAIVVTAHFDHLGVVNGEIYNGADDNASGTATALAIGADFVRRPPVNDIYIVLLDAEEDGLGGAMALLRDRPFLSPDIAVNLNLDMVSKSDVGELYIVGTYHTPNLVPFAERMAEVVPVTLLMGHDRPEDGDQDWTLQSDHAAFHRAGIPFIYLGVEDHPDYHQPTDVFETIPTDFYLASAETAIMIADALDESLETYLPASAD